MSRWTPVQERVMDLIYGDSGQSNWWYGPCGHAGHQMTVSPEGVVTCHHVISSQHEHERRDDGGQPVCGERCKEVKCGRIYTEDDVRQFLAAQAAEAAG